MKHVCSELDYCICDKQGTEPDENCPKHGNPFPPKCKECGKFMPWRNK